MKVLIIRLSAIGDIVLTSPIFRAVKQHLPQCELHFLVKPNHKNVLESNEYIDVLHLYTKDSNAFLHELQHEHFDAVIDLQKNFRSKKVARQLNCKRFTFSKLNIKKWLLVNFKIDLMPPIHIVDRCFTGVEKLGISNDYKGLDFFIPSTITSPFNEAQQAQLAEGYFTLALGSLHPTKRIPTEIIVEIIPLLSKPLVLLGGNDVNEEAEEITSLFPDKVLHLCGRCSLQTSAWVMQHSIALLAGDTGLMHIGAALNMNLVSVWGNTVPKLGMYPYMPQNQERSIEFEVKDLSCRPCSKLGFKKCPKKHFKCMRQQNPTLIAQALNGFIS